MQILSFIFLFISSLFISWLLPISQIGPDWEIPCDVMGGCGTGFFFSILFLILSLLSLLISKRKHLKLGRGAKIIYFSWVAGIIIVLMFGFNDFLYQIPVLSRNISLIIKNSYYPGIIISTILFISLVLLSYGKFLFEREKNLE
ncbi:MAG TPA: hypothetical protein VF941_02520 [Clostridia bacterium]